MDFVVYRGSWQRGSAPETKLLDDGQKMCCLGQVGHQAGVALGALKDVNYPTGSANSFPEFAEIWERLGLVVHGAYGYVRQGTWLSDAVILNDTPACIGGDREGDLIALFAANGHCLRFEDGIAPWFLPVEVARERELVVA